MPVWYFGKILAHIQTYSTVDALGTGAPMLWMWFPFVLYDVSKTGAKEGKHNFFVSVGNIGKGADNRSA